MAALTLLTVALFLFSAVGVVFLFYRKEQESQRRLKTEKELAEITDFEKDKLMAIIGSLNDGIVVFDTSSSVSFVNNSAKRYLNLASDKPSFEDISRQFPEILHLPDKLSESLTYNRMVSLSEINLNNNYFRIYINPVFRKEQIPQDGTRAHVIGATLLMQNLTHEKEVEKMKEDFTHMVIHELRAPLTAIKDAAAVMEDDKTCTMSQEDQKKLLKMIHDQAKILLSQVSTILDAGKIESGKFSLQKTPGDISKVIEGEVSFFLPEAQRKQITLIAEIGQDLPQVSFDPVRITQVINNLLSNSLKYTDPNGMIKITADNKTDESGKESIIISVADNGIGIPEEKQKLLFTKYAEIGNSADAKVKRQSTGLGLFIAKAIVDSHGGTIAVQSAPHKGTTITITLPIDQTQSHPENPVNRPEEVPAFKFPTNLASHA